MRYPVAECYPAGVTSAWVVVSVAAWVVSCVVDCVVDSVACAVEELSVDWEEESVLSEEGAWVSVGAVSSSTIRTTILSLVW